MRRFLQTAAALTFAAGVVLSASADGLDAARQALRDGLWEIARTQVGTQTCDAARLVVLESYAGEGRWDEVRKSLGKCADSKGAAFDYYRAVAAGKLDDARKLLGKSGDPAALVEARMFEADARVKAGDPEGAKRLWREVASVTNLGERVAALVAVNLQDRALLEKSAQTVRLPRLRRLVAVRLGMLLVREGESAKRGEAMIRAVAKDSPDTEGAREAFLAIADAAIAASNWKKAVETYREAAEIWPDVLKIASVQEGRGWALVGLGRREEALESFHRAAELATDATAKATAVMKEGDILSEMGRGDEAMAKYREVLAKYPKTLVAERLKSVVRVREMESRGRTLYREYRFEAARKQFAEVAAADAARRPRMAFYDILCRYGSGDDAGALAGAVRLAGDCADGKVRADVTLWLAKFRYNRREWKESRRLFSQCEGAEARLWAARAAFADNDFKGTVADTSALLEKFPDSPLKAEALHLQGESLVELARFDEAVLVFDRVAHAASASADLKLRSRLLRADCLFALGADNAARYSAAHKAYSDLMFAGGLTASRQIVVAFRIARTLEKLKRLPEAMDQLYAKVVLAYRTARIRGEALDDEARAAFSKAAFRLADEYEGLGRSPQAMNVLQLVADSDVPAAEEARQRIERISEKGRFL